MVLTYYLYSLGVVPLFMSRAFLPLFASAIAGRYGSEWGWLAEKAGIELIGALPEWVMYDSTLAILGIMALIEVIAGKIPEVRMIYVENETKLKAIAATLVCLFLVYGSTSTGPAIVETIQASAVPAMGLGEYFAYAWSLLIGAVVWFVANLRRIIFSFLMELDADDDLGLQKLLSWMEDGIGFIGVLFVIIFPILAVIISLLTCLAIYLIKRYLEARNEKKKIGCSKCQTLIYPCASTCFSCREPNNDICKIGVLGTLKNQKEPDPSAHKLQSLAWRRCYACGTRLKGKNLDQECKVCSTKPFESGADIDEFLKNLSPRLWQTLLGCFAFGFIPILGLIPGIIFYRLSIIASIKGYIPASTSFLLRWGLRLLNLVLICLQPVPILGAFTLPLMCLTNYHIYKSAIKRRGAKIFGDTPNG